MLCWISMIVHCHLGIRGAALATGIGQSVPAIAGLIFFFANKKGLCFIRFQVNVRDFWHACYNGSSEMVSQLAAAIITFLFNSVMMRLAGANGVAAITIILYGEFLFNSFHLGSLLELLRLSVFSMVHKIKLS